MMTQKLAGNLSETEEAYLESVINERALVMQAWQTMQSRFSREDINTSFSRVDHDEYWDKILPYIVVPTAKRRFPFGKAVAAAAVLAGIWAGGYYLFLQPGGQQQPVQVAGTHSRNLQLQLANGRVINLSATRNTIDLGDAQLYNNDNTLSYTAANTLTSDWNTLTVPDGKSYAVKLSDGTEVWLNAATSLQFPFNFNGNTREIRLNGEAYVKVASLANKPFTVHTPHSTIEVLGTEFNVNTYDPGIDRLSLISGAVRIKAGNHAIAVKPGMEAVYSGQKGLFAQPFDRTEVLSWRKGIHYFTNATLQDIHTVLPRWYGIEVVMDHPAITGIRFTGVLNRQKPVQFFLENLKSSTNINYYFDQHGTLHLGSSITGKQTDARQ